MFNDDSTVADYLDCVLRREPNGTKIEWGQSLARLIEREGNANVKTWQRERLAATLGAAVASRQAQLKKAEQPALTHDGKGLLSITPTLSVRTDRGSQQKLWVECTPAEFIHAVRREQAVIDGRSTSNALRLQVVEWLENDDTLRELPTVGDVCRAVGVDPAALDLDELAVDEASA
jgi:hypothetical protein